jgi:thiosulfate dehydrogenase
MFFTSVLRSTIQRQREAKTSRDVGAKRSVRFFDDGSRFFPALSGRPEEECLRGFWVGIVVGLIIFPLLVMVYLASGMAPAAATDPPMPFERFIAGTALHSRIAREAPNRDAAGLTTSDLVAGADVYKKNCSICHGAYQQPAPAISKAMFPGAPQLLIPEGMVTDDPVGVTYWKVQHGIRLSGMPSFESILNDQQIWDVSALLQQVNRLPAEAQEALKASTPTISTSSQETATPPRK